MVGTAQVLHGATTAESSYALLFAEDTISLWSARPLAPTLSASSSVMITESLEEGVLGIYFHLGVDILKSLMLCSLARCSLCWTSPTVTEASV